MLSCKQKMWIYMIIYVVYVFHHMAWIRVKQKIKINKMKKVKKNLNQNYQKMINWLVQTLFVYPVNTEHWTVHIVEA